MRAHILWIAFAALLAGCATPQNGMMLTEDTALVSIVGAAGAKHRALVNQSLADAARLTHAHGYRYFVVLATDNSNKTVTRTIPGHAINQPNNTSRPIGNGNLSSQNFPGASFTTPDRDVKEVRPGIDITIRMFREGGVDPMMDGVWNSEILLTRTAKAQ
jgi:hypothetical protein